jgi:hypothetical protein
VEEEKDGRKGKRRKSGIKMNVESTPSAQVCIGPLLANELAQ